MQECREKISIIIPVYNIAPWLEPCLQSVRAQTYPALEIIAVNDGSTDNSLTVLEQFARQEPRLKIITQPNQGPAAARQAGVKAAEGKFILFLDGDDWLAPDYCARLADMHRRTGAELVLARVERPGAEELPETVGFRASCFQEPCVLSGAQKTQLFDDFSVAMAVYGKLLSRSLADKMDWTAGSYRVGEDIFPATQALVLARQIALEPQAVYYYRQNRKGSQSTSAPERFAGLFDGFLRGRNLLEQTGTYAELAPGFEYVRRVCLISLIEKYGLTQEEEKLITANRRALQIPDGIFKQRPLKFRLRQKLFDFCLRFNLSYEVLSRFVRDFKKFIKSNGCSGQH